MAVKETPKDSQLAMMNQLLPILLYIRNFSEYNRHRPAQARLAARRQALHVAREARIKELERQQKLAYDASVQHCNWYAHSGDHYREAAIASTTKTFARESGSSSRSTSPSDEDSTDAYISDERAIEMRHQLNDLEEKFKKAIFTNTELDKERHSYMFQVELYKDDIEEMEENYAQMNKDYKDKSRSYDQLNRDYKSLQEEHNYVIECLKQRDQLIEEAGLAVIDSDESVNLSNQSQSSHVSESTADDDDDESGSESGIGESGVAHKTAYVMSLVSREAAQLLKPIEGLSLEAKLKSLLSERNWLNDEMTRLSLISEEERRRNARLEQLIIMQASDDTTEANEAQREAIKLVSDYKLKLKRSEQEVGFLQDCLDKCDAELTRLRTAADKWDKLEELLKADKRKLKRELRETWARIDELEAANAHLQKRIDKLKTTPKKEDS